MNLVVAMALGAALSATAWRATAHVFAQPMFARRNYRGIDVPVAVGVLLAVSAVGGEALVTTWEILTDSVSSHRTARLLVMAVASGFALLGFIDDVAAEGEDKGFRGHLRAMKSGRLTTGGLKLVGGGLLAVVAASFTAPDNVGWLLVDAGVIALGANLGNLFDRAPGRVTKVGMACFVVLVAGAGATGRPMLGAVALVIGASVGLLSADLGERLMLGDAGSNVIGSVLATGLVLVGGPGVTVAALVVLILLNGASEKVSFSRVIDATPPLRALDRLGRRA